MDELFGQAIKGILVSGPLAIVLFAALVVVWAKYQGLLKDQQDELKAYREAMRSHRAGESSDDQG